MKTLEQITSKIQQQLDETIQKKKSELVNGKLESGTLTIYEEPMLISDLTCGYCNQNQFFTCIENPLGTEIQRKRRVAFCCNPECTQPKSKPQPKVLKVESWQQYGVPNSHFTKSLDDYKFRTHEEFRYSNEFLKNSEIYFIMSGAAGKGKTHLAIALMKKFYLTSGQVGIFINPDKIIEELRGAQTHNENEYEIITKYAEYPLLVIDDLGIERGTEWQLEKLCEILQRRHRNQQKTIVTTNLTFEEMDKRYGVRIMRRLMENARELIFK